MDQEDASKLLAEIIRRCNLTHLVDNDVIWVQVAPPRVNASYEGSALEFNISLLTEDEIKCVISIANEWKKSVGKTDSKLSVYTRRS